MCIIVVKEKNLPLPSKETLKQCFESNRDGCGFMFNHGNKVIISKGYKNFDDFYEILQKVDKKVKLYKKACVLHFRIATHGEKSRENCHPFPISNKVEDLQSLSFTCDLAMAHNGIIYPYAKVKNKLSDTMLFIKDFIYPFYAYDRTLLKSNSLKEVIETITISRLAFLDSKGDIQLIGKFEKGDDGCYYSNTSYKFYNSFYTSRFFTNARYDDLVTELATNNEFSLFDMNDYEKKLSELTILEKGEFAYSNTNPYAYEGGGSVVYGYDENDDLYEIDNRQQTIDLIDENVCIHKKY